MLTQMIITNLILFLCSVGGIVYGIVKTIKKDMPIYFLSVFCAWVCLALGRLYMFLVLLIDQAEPNEFNLSWIAYIASFVFLFCTNYGQFGKETAKSAKGTKKQRGIALIAPLCVFILYGFNMFLFRKLNIGLNLSYIIFCAVLSLLIAQIGYFSLKYLIIAENEGNESLRALKKFNIVMLVYSFLTMVEITAPIRQSQIMMIAVYVLIALATLAVIPTLKKEAVK